MRDMSNELGNGEWRIGSGEWGMENRLKKANNELQKIEVKEARKDQGSNPKF